MRGRSKRTVQRELQRHDHKRARAAERTVLEGGNSRLVRGLRWGSKMEQPTLPDSPARYPKKKGKGRKKKDRCLGNPHGHQHEYMKEERTFDEPVYHYISMHKVGTRKIQEQIKVCAWCPREMYRRLYYYRSWTGRMKPSKWGKWKVRTG